jgi:pimeloyl-ACP methyl ester carboxylesterase
MPALTEDAVGDPGNALVLATACDLAYHPAEVGVPAFKEQLGLDATLVSVGNTQAYLAHSPDHIVLAFRGSESPTSIDGLKDWLLTNAANLLIAPEGELAAEFAAAGVTARWHQGFVSAITAVWPVLFPAAEAECQRQDRPLWVTGHSLGGALALLAAWLLKRKFVNVHQVVTFGAPMVGNGEVSAALNREFGGRITRYVNSPDPVPFLPMMSLLSNDYAHCDAAKVLGEAEAADLLAYLRGAGSQVAGAVWAGQAADAVWALVLARVTAHLMADYRKGIG